MKTTSREPRESLSSARLTAAERAAQCTTGAERAASSGDSGAAARYTADMIDHATIAEAITGFTTDTGRWRAVPAAEFAANGIIVEGAPERVALYLRDGIRDARVTLVPPAEGQARVFIGNNLRGTLRAALRGAGSTLYVGDNCSFNDLTIRSRQPGDLVACGSDVAVTGPGTWISGLEASPGRPALVVGDCCLFAADVTLRNSDGHPVLDCDSGEITNAPARGILIEPHAWLGERSAVLKDVTIGAFARVGFGSVVTGNLPRCAVARGIPATFRVDSTRYWAWDGSETGRARAAAFLARFPPGAERQPDGPGSGD
ncbi:MAG: acyltransferase [Pseudohaliea sp.]